MSAQDEFDTSSPGSLGEPPAEDEFPWNGLHIDGVPGWPSPRPLKDFLGDRDQYRVIHKLGSGGYTNVWLCRVLDTDPCQYVALKILMADASDEDCPEKSIVSRLQEIAHGSPSMVEYFCLPLDKFRITGPKGSHLCFVYPAAGPRVCPFRKPAKDLHKSLRSLASQAAEAMAALHRLGICHGDFRPPNILLRTNNLNGMQEDEVLEYLDYPLTTDVLTESNESPTDPGAPSYLVYAVYYLTKSSTLASDQISIIDFGEAYEMTSPPEDLACTMFEIRTGERLFSLFMDDRDDYISIVVEKLGPLPEPWWSSWESRPCHNQDDFPGNDIVQTYTLRDVLKRPLAFPLRGLEGEGLTIAEEEQELFADLLESMFQYDVAKRPSIEEVLKHPWFAFSAERY